MSKKLVLAGDSAFAEVAYELFTHDSDYEVVAFAVHEAYLTKDELFGLPVVPFEKVEQQYPPSMCEMHVALVYNKLNRNRKRIYTEAKDKGYVLANYISSRASIWHNVTFGDNVFVFEDNTIQPFVKVGSNNVLWSGNHIGHHSTIGSHNFISSHVVVSGFVNIGNFNFLGVNATIANNVDIGNDCLIGAGALIVKSVPTGSLVKGRPTFPEDIDIYAKFGIVPDG